MKNKKSNYNKNLKPLAKALRNKSTKGEIILWNNVLKGKKLFGLQFNRQYPVENYIVDFICRKKKLIIEVDGCTHNFKYEQDLERDKNLTKLGYHVLRFTDEEVIHHLDKVIRALESCI